MMPLPDYDPGPSPRESGQGPILCWRCHGLLAVHRNHPYACDCDREPTQTTDEACELADATLTTPEE